MTKTNAGQTIGAVGFALVSLIAATEDAARYRRKVKFHNNDLQARLGLSKWEQLDRVRTTTIDAGWLHYEPARKGSRLPGTYWVDIPAECSGMGDAPSDEGIDPIDAYRIGYADAVAGRPSRHPVDEDALDDGGRYPESGHRPRERAADSGQRTGGRSGERRGELSNLALPLALDCPSVPKTRPKPQRNTPVESARQFADEFAQWWRVYPRREGKKEAVEAFKKAVGRIVDDDDLDADDPEAAISFLVEKAQRYAELKDGENPRFIKMAKSWLDDDRFLDDPMLNISTKQPIPFAEANP